MDEDYTLTRFDRWQVIVSAGTYEYTAVAGNVRTYRIPGSLSGAVRIKATRRQFSHYTAPEIIMANAYVIVHNDGTEEKITQAFLEMLEMTGILSFVSAPVRR